MKREPCFQDWPYTWNYNPWRICSNYISNAKMQGCDLLTLKEYHMEEIPEMEWSKFKFFDWIPTVIRLQSVKDEDWQVIRKSMLKTDLEFKYGVLEKWLARNNYSKKSKVQTQNYMQALRRSGLIK
jgi:hypothetical protein